MSSRMRLERRLLYEAGRALDTFIWFLTDVAANVIDQIELVRGRVVAPVARDQIGRNGKFVAEAGKTGRNVPRHEFALSTMSEQAFYGGRKDGKTIGTNLRAVWKKYTRVFLFQWIEINEVKMDVLFKAYR